MANRFLFPAPEYALHTGKPEDFGNRETGIVITLQVLSDRDGEILAIKPFQMIGNFTPVSPGPALECTP